jgi:hypothetical protein
MHSAPFGIGKLSKAGKSITLPAGVLQKGMYFYSLTLDGILVDTKKMIVQ